MPLPVLSASRATSDADRLRHFARTTQFWAAHLGDETQLDVGIAITNPRLPHSAEANCMLEAALPAGVSPGEGMQLMQSHFAAAGVRCLQWHLKAGETSDLTSPLATQLQRLGYSASTEEVFSLEKPTLAPVEPAASPLMKLTILPARAAFAKVRDLALEADPRQIEARMLHLDDPHCDSIVALYNGVAVGQISVLSVGDIGRIDQLYVALAHRRQGIGGLLVARAIEICARSQFRHILLGVRESGRHAKTLFARFGFRKIGQQTVCSMT